mmetsp:Transcript_18627/g.39134  ORF Transcript_18627/g.39134 Transcript_18627/m.39134 type:complete len:402 (-) Transcript_18627:5947-7152(-)
MGLFDQMKGKGSGKNPAVPSGAAVPILPPSLDFGKMSLTLRLAKARTENHMNQSYNQAKGVEREVANLLKAENASKAATKMEEALRMQVKSEALERVSLVVSTLSSRIRVLETCPRSIQAIPSDLKEAMVSIAFAAPRVDIPELNDLVSQLKSHFGPVELEMAQRNEGPDVVLIDDLLCRLLTTHTPEPRVVMAKMEEVAIQYGVSWRPPPEHGDLQKKSILDYKPTAVAAPNVGVHPGSGPSGGYPGSGPSGGYPGSGPSGGYHGGDGSGGVGGTGSGNVPARPRYEIPGGMPSGPPPNLDISAPPPDQYGGRVGYTGNYSSEYLGYAPTVPYDGGHAYPPPPNPYQESGMNTFRSSGLHDEQNDIYFSNASAPEARPPSGSTSQEDDLMRRIERLDKKK